jgi:hypothetical protein
VIWTKQKLIEKISYRCLNCNYLNESYVNERLSNGKPTIFQVARSSKKCANCESTTSRRQSTYYLCKCYTELRNPDTYSEIDSLKVVVFDEDAIEIEKVLTYSNLFDALRY